jgi:iron complex outermembrane receptor protein
MHRQQLNRKKKKPLPLPPHRPRRKVPGDRRDHRGKHSATATKTDTPIEKTPQSISVVTREEMEMKQPTTVKEALAYTPGVFSTRGSSTTYDVVTIRGFTTSTTVNTNQYLDGMKLQGITILKYRWTLISLNVLSDARANVGAVRQQQPGRYRQHGQQAPDHRAAERNPVQNGHR